MTPDLTTTPDDQVRRLRDYGPTPRIRRAARLEIARRERAAAGSMRRDEVLITRKDKRHG